MAILAVNFPIFFWMPLLAFLFIGGWVLGVVAMGMSLYVPHSRIAFNLSATTIGWGVLSPLIVAILPEAKVYWHQCLYFAGPIIPGLLAMLIDHGNGRMLLRTGRIVFALIVGGAILTGIYLWGCSSCRAGSRLPSRRTV